MLASLPVMTTRQIRSNTTTDSSITEKRAKTTSINEGAHIEYESNTTKTKVEHDQRGINVLEPAIRLVVDNNYQSVYLVGRYALLSEAATVGLGLR